MNRHILLSCGTVLLFAMLMPLAAAAQHYGTHRQNAAAHSSSAQTVYELWYVDAEPSFPGGEAELLRFINAEREYPSEAYSQGVSGRVICSFTITADGHVCDVRVIRSVEETLDREAMRIIRNMPRWVPAMKDDGHVAVNYILPIPFRL